jgi:hypothetical protein
MTTMSLPSDICRCHDGDCPQRASCARWLERDSDGHRVVHAASLREGDPCTAYIHSDDGVRVTTKGVLHVGAGLAKPVLLAVTRQAAGVVEIGGDGLHPVFPDSYKRRPRRGGG